ncbi:hypothetical protein E6A54_05670 [Lactobacillus johnsonii]|uniref:O-antigen ligase family protein n=1 Tax=Lactobacillus johnsonii TaxID=33959 RepID=UPI001303AA3D|nr:O-antigen ligase family protein [Lactobacillus johnsonii]QGY96787.1 hypothetical protein E6A54_05670 [Lactobacillus johnsonii]
MRERSANKNKKDNLFIRIITYALAFGMIINCNSIYGSGIYGSRLNNILLILSFFEVLIIVAIHKVENIDWRKYLFIILLLLGYLLVYVLVQQKTSTDLITIKMILTFLLFFSLAYLAYKNDSLPLLLTAYVNLITIVAVVSLLFWILGSNLHLIQPNGVYLSKWAQPTFQSVSSYYGLYFETQGMGAMWRNSAIFAEAPIASLNFSLALTIESLLIKKGKFYKFRILILALAVISTLSSTGYICLILLILCKMLTGNDRNKYVFIFKKIITPIILIIGVILINHFFSQKMMSSSGVSRGQDYVNAFKAWSRHPILGVGLNMANSLPAEDRLFVGKFGYSNSFGKILGETGLYITILYIISIIRSIYIGIKSKESDRVYFTVVLVYLFITTIFVNTFIMFFFFSLMAVWVPNSRALDTNDYDK